MKTKDLVELKAKKVWDKDEGAECQEFHNLKFAKKKPIFDIVIVVPMVNDYFSIQQLKKLKEE